METWSASGRDIKLLSMDGILQILNKPPGQGKVEGVLSAKKFLGGAYFRVRL